MIRRVFHLLLLCLGPLLLPAAQELRIATYNVENYLEAGDGERPVKTAQSRARVVESIQQLKPDLLALQEMGGTNMLADLQRQLKEAGVDLPYREWMEGFDTNIHLAILSRYPLLETRKHTDGRFLIGGQSFKVNRGFLETTIQPSAATRITVINAHLKSRRQSIRADEGEIRRHEAVLLRRRIDEILTPDTNRKLLVVGDFNDSPDSEPVRTVIGKLKMKLTDFRPFEQNGDSYKAEPRQVPRRIAWTHHYGKEDSYSRVDYILGSSSLSRLIQREKTFVLALPNWGEASDHRPLVATFRIQ